MRLRQGMNPHQGVGPVVPVEPGRWPVRVLNGEPSLINLLDALNAWQLVSEAAAVAGRPAAASFKHLSPAGAALAGALDPGTAALYGAGGAPGPVTGAYLRARDADPKSSYGDLAAVSHEVDEELAELLQGLVCDGIVAPGYAPGAVARLARKKGGRFLVLAADPGYRPPPTETREVFGLRLTQQRDAAPVGPELLDPVTGERPGPAGLADVLLGLTVLRYTQSNSVCYLRDGVTLGIGAGQQSRVDCTRLAGAKTDTWWLRRHPAVRAMAFRPGVRRQERVNWRVRCVEGDLTPDEQDRLAAVLTGPVPVLTAADRTAWLAGLDGVTFASDGALPFRDNVDHAHRHGVARIVEPGGSIRSGEVADACREHGITLLHTGLRLFHH
ncbi:phosphoribosylaminoimidazolecarboxamide formyltransferase [Kitasatospora sp. NPDC058965]|uniref:phosphoribosylaminoimidazolecarboxamide formyltransferase n=1 Tax=Kitasatospora sp. NPDC058965 TaxID=3346682 RepID=UPI0036BAD38E